MRRSGILLPISSLSSKYGIGSFSKEAFEFVDFLEKSKQKLWQILPLGPTGYGDSPYQAFSTFAGNPYFIDLEALIEEELLTEEECRVLDGDQIRIDYAKQFSCRYTLLRQAYKRVKDIDENEKKFRKENSFWLEDYALYMAIKNSKGGKSWIDWDGDLKLRKEEALNYCRHHLKEEIEFYQFQQYYFYKQWIKLKKYANEKGIKVIGDIPIYVSLDSADAWAHPELFLLDELKTPKLVSGCPPDAFSPTGQLWGNPIYDWEYHKQTGYDWWKKRMHYCFLLYDIVRIDHFRGFDEYYTIPYGSENAMTGKWEKGPGMDFFDHMKKELGKREIIAEDLGFLTDSVIELLKNTGYPGMKVLQFAFDSREESDYYPHNYSKNCVVYTGTHDNDTTTNWFKELDEEDKHLAIEYLDLKNDKDICDVMIHTAFSSVADTCIIPMQDYLEVGEEGRINKPSTLGDNWTWRLKGEECTDQLAKRISDLVRIYQR